MNVNQGIGDRNSSRVLKPPGGGHSNIFAAPEVSANKPRPKYDQQNSSNLNVVMGTVDPNVKVQPEPECVEQPQAAAPKSAAAQESAAAQPKSAENGRGRVPPGGFSSGLW